MSFSNTACTNTDTLGKKVSENKIFGTELRGISTANTRAPCAKSNILCNSLQFLQFLKKKKKTQIDDASSTAGYRSVAPPIIHG